MEEKVIRNILDNWHLGKVLSVLRIRQGFANHNFKVVTGLGQYVLRLCRQREAEDLLPEVELARVLVRHGIPTPLPLPDRHGKAIVVTPAGPAVLFPWVEGVHPPPGPGMLREAGRLLGRLHSVPGREVPRRPNTLQPESCRQLVAGTGSGPCLDEDLRHAWLTIFREVSPHLDPKLPHGPVHGDLFPDNLLVREGEIVALLDLEEFAWDVLLFDVGMTLNGFCFRGNRYDRRAAGLLLAAYEEVRPFTAAERRCLDAWVRWSALAMACWHIRDCQRHGPQPGQPQRIRELILRSLS